MCIRDRVYRGEKTWSDFMAPIERVIYKVCGIDPNEEMIDNQVKMYTQRTGKYLSLIHIFE